MFGVMRRDDKIQREKMKIEIEFKEIETQEQEDYLHALIDEFVNKLNVLGLKVISYNKPKKR